MARKPKRYKVFYYAKGEETEMPKSIMIMAQNKEEAVEKCKDEVRACTGKRVVKAVPQSVSLVTNLEKKKQIADEFEQFLFERGEYDYPKNDSVKWIISEDRYEVADGILKDILNVGMVGIRQYIETELMFMDREDQTKLLGKKILELIKEV